MSSVAARAYHKVLNYVFELNLYLVLKNNFTHYFVRFGTVIAVLDNKVISTAANWIVVVGGGLENSFKDTNTINIRKCEESHGI